MNNRFNTRQYLSILWIFGLILFSSCKNADVVSSNTNPKNEISTNIIIEHDGLQREYILYVPESYTGNDPVPLVFNFHGYTQYADDYMLYADFRSIADTAKFILVYPQGTLHNGLTHWNVDGSWTQGSTVDDVGFTEAMIDTLTFGYNIDQSRIYATGLSNGGYMSFQLACQLNDKFAAIASVAATMIPTTFKSCSPQHPTPILQMHGTNDPLVPYTGNIISVSVNDVLQYWIDYNNCNTNPTTTNLPHNLNTINGSTAQLIVYDGGDNHVRVEHFKINGGGHEWPGSSGNMDINASDEIWKFFSNYDINGLIE
ncbi:alpha/beta hydrolase family esterase [Candidatus Neomarinimicrobiota bacterium]